MIAARAVGPLVAAAIVLTLAGCGRPSAAPEEGRRSSEPAPSSGSGASSGTGGSSSAGTTAPYDVLPAARTYVDAVNRRDLDGLVNAFRPDGQVVDVSRTITGRDAIRTWARNEVIGGSLRVVRVVERRPDGQKLLVHWAPAGSNGWPAHYDSLSRVLRSVRRTCSTRDAHLAAIASISSSHASS
ncbi:nuclear transport factor 2 family protein [Kribbella sp. C-35]|uniref:nuclear transport factor 2 family protein n=1 Tax=Kribbella sp. C-35 TaxID=2789276 RepID=UPI00397C0101